VGFLIFRTKSRLAFGVGGGFELISSCIFPNQLVGIPAPRDDCSTIPPIQLLIMISGFDFCYSAAGVPSVLIVCVDHFLFQSRHFQGPPGYAVSLRGTEKYSYDLRRPTLRFLRRRPCIRWTHDRRACRAFRGSAARLLIAGRIPLPSEQTWMGRPSLSCSSQVYTVLPQSLRCRTTIFAPIMWASATRSIFMLRSSRLRG
jgi:hypothetical protein